MQFKASSLYQTPDELSTVKNVPKMIDISGRGEYNRNIIRGRRRNMERTELAEKMLRYRAEERISQRELASRAGLTVQTVNAVENGTQSPSKLTEAKIKLVIDRSAER